MDVEDLEYILTSFSVQKIIAVANRLWWAVGTALPRSPGSVGLVPNRSQTNQKQLEDMKQKIGLIVFSGTSKKWLKKRTNLPLSGETTMRCLKPCINQGMLGEPVATWQLGKQMPFGWQTTGHGASKMTGNYYHYIFL